MNQISCTLWIAIFLCLGGCARPGSPTGGPKDTTPPRVDTSNSTRNFTTHFNERRIELTFDEWVVLKEPGKQILVSPPLLKTPQTRIKGKTLILEFDDADTLKVNTTYTINFGTAVRDLHEDNPAVDLRFVFSTGAVIDSLGLQGSVVDALSASPVENATVMLFESDSDSIVARERPYYFARTDKTGRFNFTNLRAGEFKCIAVIDDGVNPLRWDPTEKIAFADSVVLIRDTFQVLSVLRLFKNQPPPALTGKADTKTYGRIKLTYTAPPDSVPLAADRSDILFRSKRVADTLWVWYHPGADSVAWRLIAGTDTIEVPALSGRSALQNFRLRWAEDVAPPQGNKRIRTEPVPPPAAKPSARTVTVLPGRTAPLAFNYPLAGIDTALCILTSDSLRVYGFSTVPDSADPAVYRMHFPWMSGKSYRFDLLPDAATALNGIRNADTLTRIFTIPPEKQLGSLNLALEGLTSGNGYVLQLTEGSNNVVEERRFVAAQDSMTVPFRYLQTLQYTAILVEDRNLNGRWDSGDYYAHRQPERIFTKKLDALRANWELESAFDIGTTKRVRKQN